MIGILSYREVVHTSGIYDGVGIDLRQGSPVTPVNKWRVCM